MNRFILLTFALLGLTFYQMSGGSEFQPPARPVIVETALEPAAAPVEVATVTPASTEVSLSTTLPQVAVAATDAAQDDTTLAPRQVSATIRDAVTEALEDTAQELASVETVSAESTASEEALADTTEQRLVVPSLISDIRSVTGNSVNMRAGPGTDFDVVDRLNRGSEVEVLQDPGTGWLELRAVDSGVTGWIADWLVSAS
jgi:hypothetical protein